MWLWICKCAHNILNGNYRDFPAWPVVKTISHCRGHEFNPWLGNYDPACCEVWPKVNKQNKRRLQNGIMCSASVTCISLHWCSVTQSCPTLCDPMDCCTPGLPVLHHLPELAQSHVHRVGDAIQPSHPLSSPSPLALNLPQHQGLVQLQCIHE